MKTKLTTLVFLLMCSATFSQSLFNKKYLFGTPPDYFLKTLQLPDKEYILYGGWNYPTAGFLSKLDTNGTMIWAKRVEYQNINYVPVLYSAILDYDQHVIITTQDPYPATGSLLKLDTSGNALWDLHFDFPVSDIVLTSDSNYAVVGRKNLAVFGLNAEIQFYKVSPAGSVIFGYEYFNPNNFINYNNLDKITYGLIQYTDGNYFVLAHVNEDIFIMKINANGQLIWNKKYVQSVFNSYYVLKPPKWKMNLMPDSTILICGRINYMFSHELICFKINSDGNVLWSKKYSTGGVLKISQLNTTVNADSTICIFLALADSSETIHDHAIFKIDQSGNLLDTLSLRIPLKPVYPMWFGQDQSNHYNFIQTPVFGMGSDTIQIVLIDSLFYSPCVTDTFASLTMQNFPDSVIDSFPLITQPSSTIPLSDTLIITPINFSNIDFCFPAEINTLNFSEQDLSVFPNPAQDIFTIELNSTKQKIIHLQILNVFGAIIYDEQIQNSGSGFSKKINLKEIAVGIYFIKAGNEVRKFVKE
ncbi:MAG: T9SS type A sorting domain-containing protein [Bacteroidia bacterium]